MSTRTMSRIGVVVLGLAIAIATLSFASAQQEPPHRFYGTDGTPGDVIAVQDDVDQELGSTTVAADGSWYIDVDRDAAGAVHFTVNGEAAEAETTSTGAGQSAVSLTVMAMEDACPTEDAMADDSLSEDVMSEDGGDAMADDCPTDDGAMDDGSMDDGSMDDGSMLEGEDEGDDVGLPATGSGGLADGGVSAGLIGLLIALGAAAIVGLGVRRVRNRA